jgi:hypothetical protein
VLVRVSDLFSISQGCFGEFDMLKSCGRIFSARDCRNGFGPYQQLHKQLKGANYEDGDDFGWAQPNLYNAKQQLIDRNLADRPSILLQHPVCWRLVT